jgi:hypothetical protein
LIEEKSMSSYTVWEEAVTQQIAATLQADYSDAAGVIEAQSFYLQQSWGKGMDEFQTAAKIMAEITSPS